MPGAARIRVAAVQSCPELKYPATLSPSATAAGSASSSTTIGALPPSSRCTRLSVSAAVRAIHLPVATDPVSETSRTSRWRTSPAPTGSPSPVMTLSTPGGGISPASPPERRADLPDRHHQRVVPRRDLPHDADRLAPDHARVALHVLARRAPLQHPRGAREEAHVVDRDRHLLQRDAHRLADVRRLQAAELLAVLLEPVGQPEQRTRALARGRVAPAGEGGLGGGHRAVDVGLRALRHLRDRLARGRVDDLAHAALDGVDEVARDQVAQRVLRDAHVGLLRSGSGTSCAPARGRGTWRGRARSTAGTARRRTSRRPGARFPPRPRSGRWTSRGWRARRRTPGRCPAPPRRRRASPSRVPTASRSAARPGSRARSAPRPAPATGTAASAPCPRPGR